MSKKKVIVIGCGAAGMMAGIAAARNGASVTIVEKNEKPGKKIFISGKGRCNVTNACNTHEFFDFIVRNGKFLYSAVYNFSNFQVQDFFNDRGCPLKVERGERVFPVSDRSSDIIKTLVKELKDLNVEILYNTPVKDVLAQDNKVYGVKISENGILSFDSVIVATGGLSYPSTGSTGDGYLFAKSLGHKIQKCAPSLVPLVTKEEWCKKLQGLSLKNVRLYNKKTKGIPHFDKFGEMLFTHFGVSGPLVLSASTIYEKGSEWKLFIDLKPALSIEQLEARIGRDLYERKDKIFRNSLDGLFPRSLIPVMVEFAESEMIGIDKNTKSSGVNPRHIRSFAELCKALPITIISARGYNEAIITRGGVDVKEINPSTMESKLCSGLYFAGEVLDVDAYTGGFNLQIAWSTGSLAGESAASGE